MPSWTRLDRLLIVLAFVFPGWVITSMLLARADTYIAEEQVLANITAVAGTVRDYHQATGRWFPLVPHGNRAVRVYLNPFDDLAPDYQNLNNEWLWRENNHGMVLQLVGYDEPRDRWLGSHQFKLPFKQGEPYIRILVDYGSAGDTETAILRRLETEFAAGLLAKLDDHLYVLDIRGLVNE
jgi:hypothetical protein